MNSHSIKLTGKFEIPESLEIDHEYHVSVYLSITGISKHSQENGEFEYTYHARPTTGAIDLDLGRTIKLEDKKKQSVKLRQQLGFIAQERGLDEQEFYNSVMNDIRHYTLEILDFLEGIKKN